MKNAPKAQQVVARLPRTRRLEHLIAAGVTAMKVVIQCSATKDPKAGSFSLNAGRVEFIAHPEVAPILSDKTFCRPDDLIPGSRFTWRDHLVEYNKEAENPDLLLPAGDLYSPPIYRRLIEYVGSRNLFVLSAGWGLVGSSFLVPDYDITFSPRTDPYKRRTPADRFNDFAQLQQADLGPNETVYFFGAKDYLPLYCKLTRNLEVRKVIYFVSRSIDPEPGFDYFRYSAPGTNWHYRCAAAFIEGTMPS